MLDGDPISFSRPVDAINRGVCVVQQERTLVKQISIAENIFLNRTPRRFGFVDYRRLYREAEEWLNRVGLDLDVRKEAEVLSPGQGQLVEIARALSGQSRFLLLDEPTASIGPEDAQRLFTLMRSLCASGTALLFVSHKLDEVYEIADKVTVIRDGHNVVNGMLTTEIKHDELVEAMVGREHVQVEFPPRAPRGPVALEVKGLQTQFGHRCSDLILHRGEIVGLYGLIGAGRTEYARAIIGIDKRLGGTVVVDGVESHISNPGSALARYRMGYVSEDRKGEGLIVSDTVLRNATMPIWGRISTKLGMITRARAVASVIVQLQRLGVKMTSLDQLTSELSGGNQQKISLGRWVAAGVDVLIVDEPTVGVDIGAKEEIHRLLWGLADSRTAILMISSDLREIVQVSDRVVVMVKGALTADIPNSQDYDKMSQQIMSAIVSRRENAA